MAIKRQQNVAKRSTVRPAALENSDSIKVVCRFRPTRAADTHSKIEIATDTNSVIISDLHDRKQYSFDTIFGSDTGQQQVFNEVQGVINAVMGGFNGTVLAYGQTSAGKSFTMEGPNMDDEVMKGVIPRTIDALFEAIDKATLNMTFEIKVAYYEIYCEKVRDLLNPSQDNLRLREAKGEGFIIPDVTEEMCENRERILGAIHRGKTNRATAPTLMNAESSRSHSILSLSLQQTDANTGRKRKSRLFLVDLAGSEKVSKTGATGALLHEAININSSLTTLGMVIQSLCDGKQHIPYRDSVLTKLLMESLGGNSKTTMIICCAPENDHNPETVSTLRFGERAKRIQNNAKVNEELSVSELQERLDAARKEIAALKKRLEGGSADDREAGDDAVGGGEVTAALPFVEEALTPSPNDLELRWSDEELQAWKQGKDDAERVLQEKIQSLQHQIEVLEEELRCERHREEVAQEARAHAEAETEALRSTIEALQQRLLAAEVEHEKGEKVRMDSREAAMELEVEEAINAESKDHADLRAYFESPSVAQEKLYPEGWTQVLSSSGEPYYYNVYTAETKWELPDELAALVPPYMEPTPTRPSPTRSPEAARLSEDGPSFFATGNPTKLEEVFNGVGINSVGHVLTTVADDTNADSAAKTVGPDPLNDPTSTQSPDEVRPPSNAVESTDPPQPPPQQQARRRLSQGGGAILSAADSEGFTTVEVFENERRYKGVWAGKNLAQLPHFSDSTGTIYCAVGTIDSVVSPRGWSWLEGAEWTVDSTYTQQDKDGWSYAVSYDKLVENCKNDSSHVWPNVCQNTRRRKWTRRVVPSSESGSTTVHPRPGSSPQLPSILKASFPTASGGGSASQSDRCLMGLESESQDSLSKQNARLRGLLAQEIRSLQQESLAEDAPARKAAEAYAAKYVRLRDEYDTYVQRLSLKLQIEQKARVTAEDRLDEAVQQMWKTGQGDLSVAKKKGSLFGGLFGASTVKDPTDSESQQTQALAIAQARAAQLQSELLAEKKAHTIVLDTKDAVVRSLIKQNTELARQRDAANRKIDELQQKEENLTNLLRSMQHLRSSSGGGSNVVRSSVIQGGGGKR